MDGFSDSNDDVTTALLDGIFAAMKGSADCNTLYNQQCAKEAEKLKVVKIVGEVLTSLVSIIRKRTSLGIIEVDIP